MFFTTVSLLSVLAIGASAMVHDVQVGNPTGDNKLQFVPEAIFANVGDQVVFHFNPANHSVTQSSFADPCSKQDGGFNSGFMPVMANSSQAQPTFAITVNDTKPIWVYCAQAKNTPNSHCGKGMIFAVNCPSPPATNSFDSFKAKALAIGAQLEAAAMTSSSSAAYGGEASSIDASYGGEGASATANAGYYPGTSTYTAAYGDATVPPPASVSTVTQTVSWNSSVYTTTYASYPGSPNPTPNAEPKVYQVTVGANKALAFDPPRVSAQPGDIISFTFMGANHSVTQSAFADPCRKIVDNTTGLPNGFDSGFQFVGNSSNFITWNVTVNTTAPVWAYCKQHATASHCGAGMVFAINSDESGPRNFNAFSTLAKQLNGTTAQDNTNNATSAGADASASKSGAGFTSASATVVLGAVLFAVAALL